MSKKLVWTPAKPYYRMSEYDMSTHVAEAYYENSDRDATEPVAYYSIDEEGRAADGTALYRGKISLADGSSTDFSTLWPDIQKVVPRSEWPANVLRDHNRRKADSTNVDPVLSQLEQAAIAELEEDDGLEDDCNA